MINSTKKLLNDYAKRHPKLQIQDIFKFIYQSSFGCEHLVTSKEKAREYIFNEYVNCDFCTKDKIEYLDGDYVRLPLNYIDRGLSIDTLCSLFVASSKKEDSGLAYLKEKLKMAEAMVEAGELPFDINDFIKAKNDWANQGYPAVHHSEIYRCNYQPAYRVIAKKYVEFLPLFIELDKMLKETNVKIAIEGGSASGKSTLSKMLNQVYGCAIINMDDFFLQPHQRTKERFKEVGGNVDWERFLKEVVVPLNNGLTVKYQKFDCKTVKLCDWVEVQPNKLTVIEGVYSMYPQFKKYYDYSVFLDISEKTQASRIIKRNPDLKNRFFDEWIPLENAYFTATDIKNRCDMIIKIKE